MGGPRVVAIIPARGGSVGIPRKNARLLAGKPLLAYTIEAALAASSLDAVFVSTDDEELRAIATRSGATCLDRPAALADGASTLDEVMVDAVNRAEGQSGAFDYVVTIQATSPLTRAQTIDTVVQRCIDRALDTVLTVVDARHLSWGTALSGELVPRYEARVNRQQLPAHYQETGGVVCCRRALLKQGTRFGAAIGVVEVEKLEAIDIDDHFDWWLAEKSLKRKRIVLRTLGNRGNGLGHAYRCLTLADRLIDHELLFWVGPADDLAADLIRRRFYPLTISSKLDAPEIDAFGPDLIINDVLDTRDDEMNALRAFGARLINFEDRGPGAARADAVINAMYGEGELSGPAFCVLRDEFYSAQPIEVREPIENVLLTFGGTDPNDLSRRCLEWLDGLTGEWSITVLLGLGYPNPDAIRDVATTASHPVRVVVNTSVVSQEMMNADLAVTSAGRTVFELASLGVPMVVIPQNDREMTHTFARGDRGLIALPRASEIDETTVRAAARALIDDVDERRRLHQDLLSMNIRSGVDRILTLLDEVLHQESL